ncbi:MAG: 1-(5-phosphoribosyl)-5-[(5-phosphoribosylamino)methylideneamino] imidazole-4-carboxamide isomerase [Candidatus Micrarchaeota archaeon]
MEVIPAIDLLDGMAVRLERGRRETAKAYSGDPVALARALRGKGAQMLHVVSLGSAFCGRLMDLELVRGIAKVSRVQYGGGVRSIGDVQALIGAGVERIVVGTAVVSDSALCRRLCSRFPNRMVAALDVLGGGIGINGWTSSAPLPDSLDGFSAVLATDVSRDGMLAGPNAALVRRVGKRYGLPVIASGGVSSLQDLRKLARAGAQAAIVGKALYENRFSLEDAIRVAQDAG